MVTRAVEALVVSTSDRGERGEERRARDHALGLVGMKANLLPLADGQRPGPLPGAGADRDAAELVDERRAPDRRRSRGVQPAALCRRGGELRDAGRGRRSCSPRGKADRRSRPATPSPGRPRACQRAASRPACFAAHARTGTPCRGRSPDTAPRSPPRRGPARRPGTARVARSDNIRARVRQAAASSRSVTPSSRSSKRTKYATARGHGRAGLARERACMVEFRALRRTNSRRLGLGTRLAKFARCASPGPRPPAPVA
jgi:hypothetical protein